MLRLLFLTTIVQSLRPAFCTSAIKMSLKAVDFEVFGTVQGVFFRKFTKLEADRLGLHGWCMNTSQGTVVGYVEGPEEKVESMLQWLKNTGSPASRIEKAEFKNTKDIKAFTMEDFTIRKK